MMKLSFTDRLWKTDRKIKSINMTDDQIIYQITILPVALLKIFSTKKNDKFYRLLKMKEFRQGYLLTKFRIRWFWLSFLRIIALSAFLYGVL